MQALGKLARLLGHYDVFLVLEYHLACLQQKSTHIVLVKAIQICRQNDGKCGAR